jgi:hypothetical protein
MQATTEQESRLYVEMFPPPAESMPARGQQYVLRNGVPVVDQCLDGGFSSPSSIGTPWLAVY